MILGEGATMAVIGLVIGGLAAVPLSRLSIRCWPVEATEDQAA